MKPVAIALMAFFSLLGCNKVRTTSDTQSIVLTSNKWQNPKSIPVCIMNRGDLGAELFDDAKNFTINEYANKTGVNFVGWGNCSDGDRNATIVRVFFNRTHDWDNAGGTTAGGGLSMVGPSAQGCGDTCKGGTMRIDVGRSGNYPNTGLRDFTVTQTRATMVHEFGHVVGLLHEHERTDSPNCQDIPTKTPNGGDVVYVGKFDPNSIMGYCHDQKLTTLSAGDIAGVQFLYPALGGGAPAGNGGGQPAPTVKVPGSSYYLVMRNSGKCADISGASLVNGGNLQQWDCNGTGAQIFQLLDGGAGSFFLKNVNSGKCVDVDAWNVNAGANVQQWDCSGGDNQRVYLQPTSNGYYRTVFAHSNRCLDVNANSLATGANIQQWDCLQTSPGQEIGFFPVK